MAKKEPIFKGTVAVELQGPRALEFVSLNRKQAEFYVIGISNPKIRVIDYRPAVKQSMRSIEKTGRVEELADYFNQPASVTLISEKDGQITVRLKKSRAKKTPRHMLWIAIGIGKKIPMYEYKKVEIQQMRDKKFALFSVYKRPKLFDVKNDLRK
jgi:hypothetical protein